MRVSLGASRCYRSSRVFQTDALYVLGPRWHPERPVLGVLDRATASQGILLAPRSRSVSDSAVTYLDGGGAQALGSGIVLLNEQPGVSAIMSIALDLVLDAWNSGTMDLRHWARLLSDFAIS